MPITASNPFKGRQHPGELILLCVRLYLRYPLSYEHVAELAGERGVGGGRQLHLALVTGVRPRTEQTLPSASEAGAVAIWPQSSMPLPVNWSSSIPQCTRNSFKRFGCGGHELRLYDGWRG